MAIGSEFLMVFGVIIIGWLLGMRCCDRKHCYLATPELEAMQKEELEAEAAAAPVSADPVKNMCLHEPTP